MCSPVPEDSSSEAEAGRSDPVYLLTVIRVVLLPLVRVGQANLRRTYDIKSVQAKELSHRDPFYEEAGRVKISLRQFQRGDGCLFLQTRSRRENVLGCWLLWERVA